MTPSIVLRGISSRPVHFHRRSKRSALQRAHTRSTDATGEAPDGESDLFTELKYLAEKQKEIIRKREEKKTATATSSSLFTPPPTKTKDFKNLVYIDIDETSSDRAHYHNQLFEAAKMGNAAVAEEVIRLMVSDGFQPGPRAYHALVFAHVKHGSASGALAAIRRAHSSGLLPKVVFPGRVDSGIGARPLTESYIVLIYAFLKEKNIKIAEAVFTSMLRPHANADAEKGWLMLATMLFRQGFEHEALACLEEGRNESFLPDRVLFEHIIKHRCNNHDYEGALEELSELLVCQEAQIADDLFCENGHVRHLMEHFAGEGDVRMLMWLSSLPKALDIQCFNSVLRGVLNAWDAEDVEAPQLFDHLWDTTMTKSNADADAIALLYCLEAELKKGNALKAQKLFIGNQLIEVTRRREHELMRHLVTPLLHSLCEKGLPISMYQVLQALSLGRLDIPDEAIIPDSHGRTFLTKWIDERMPTDEHRNGTGQRRDYAPGAAYTSDGGHVRLVDGVKIGIYDCAVDNDGVILPISKMKVAELRAECEMRGLSSEGLRSALQETIVKARRASPSIMDEIKRRRALKRKEKKAMRGSRGRSKVVKEPETEVTYTRIQYVGGKMVSKEDVTLKEAEALTGFPMNTDATEKSEKEGDVSLSEETAETEQQRDKKWSDINGLQQRIFSYLRTDATAGVDAAAVICERASTLGAFPSLEDFEAVVRLNEWEKSAPAAWVIGKLIHRDQAVFMSDEVDPGRRQEEYDSRVLKIAHSCCRICLEAGLPDACTSLIHRIEDRGFEVEPSLLLDLALLRSDRKTSRYEALKPKVDEPTDTAEVILPLQTVSDDDAETESSMSPLLSDVEENLEHFGKVERLEARDEENPDDDDHEDEGGDSTQTAEDMEDNDTDIDL